MLAGGVGIYVIGVIRNTVDVEASSLSWPADMKIGSSLNNVASTPNNQLDIYQKPCNHA
jgi:hypothetical protein